MQSLSDLMPQELQQITSTPDDKQEIQQKATEFLGDWRKHTPHDYQENHDLIISYYMNHYRTYTEHSQIHKEHSDKLQVKIKRFKEVNTLLKDRLIDARTRSNLTQEKTNLVEEISNLNFRISWAERFINHLDEDKKAFDSYLQNGITVTRYSNDFGREVSKVQPLEYRFLFDCYNGAVARVNYQNWKNRGKKKS